MGGGARLPSTPQAAFHGALFYYENVGSAASPTYEDRTGAASPFDGIDVGDRSAPVFADVDGDADIDLVVGGDDDYGNGALYYYENPTRAHSTTAFLMTFLGVLLLVVSLCGFVCCVTVVVFFFRRAHSKPTANKTSTSGLKNEPPSQEMPETYSSRGGEVAQSKDPTGSAANPMQAPPTNNAPRAPLVISQSRVRVATTVTAPPIQGTAVLS